MKSSEVGVESWLVVLVFLLGTCLVVLVFLFGICLVVLVFFLGTCQPESKNSTALHTKVSAYVKKYFEKLTHFFLLLFLRSFSDL